MRTVLDTILEETWLELGPPNLEEQPWEGEVSRTGREYVRWVQQSLNRVLGSGLAVDRAILGLEGDDQDGTASRRLHGRHLSHELVADPSGRDDADRVADVGAGAGEIMPPQSLFQPAKCRRSDIAHSPHGELREGRIERNRSNNRWRNEEETHGSTQGRRSHGTTSRARRRNGRIELKNAHAARKPKAAGIQRARNPGRNRIVRITASAR